MFNKRKGLTVVATLVAASALFVAGAFYSSAQRGEVTSPAAANAVSSLRLAPDQLRSVLLYANEQPTGTQMLAEASFAEAAQAKMLAPAAEGPRFSIKPAVCANYLQLAVPSLAQQPGWIQFGTRPATTTHGGGTFSALVTSLPGGADLDSLRSIASTCQSGTITLKGLGVTGTVSLSEFATPQLGGARTYGIVATTKIAGVSTEDVAAEMACQAPPSPTGTTSSVSLTCGSTTVARKGAPTGYTDVHYFAYVAMGEVLVEACEVEKDLANEMAATLYSRGMELAG